MRKWSEVEKELFTAEEIRESKLRVAIVVELIKARSYFSPNADGHTGSKFKMKKAVKKPGIPGRKRRCPTSRQNEIRYGI